MLLSSQMRGFILLLAVSFGLAVLVGTETALAQHTVRPLVADFTLEARGMASQTITIDNPTERQARVYATVNAVRVDVDGAIDEFIQPAAADNTRTVTSWIQISRGRIEIPAGERHEIPLRIQVHPNAEPGIYHAFIGFPRARNRDEAEDLVFRGQAPGTMLRIEIADGRQAFLRLENFTTERFVIDPQQSQFTYTIANPGDVSLVPQGELIVYDGRGREIGSVPVNPTQKNIAPGEAVTFQSELPAGGQLGRHRALLALTYGDGQRASITDTIFFHQLPLPQLIIIFLICLAVATLAAYWIHRRYTPVLVEEYDAVTLSHRTEVFSSDAEHDIDLRSAADEVESDNSHTQNDQSTS